MFWTRFAKNLKGSALRLLSRTFFYLGPRLAETVPLVSRSNFHTLTSRPVSGNLHRSCHSRPSWPPTAIILQGNILWKNKFTWNTAISYRKMFPETTVVISTWREEFARLSQEIPLEGIEVVYSDKPKNAGFANTNLQMVTAHAGVKRAKELGAQYVMKSRTDHRVYNNLALGSLHSWIRHSDVIQQPNQGQRERIVFLSLGSFLYRLYGLSDTFTFSHISDALDYWTGELDEKNSIAPARTLREYAIQQPAEVWFYSQWLSKYEPLEWTLDHYWKSISERTVVLDSRSIDLFWPKYTSRENRWENYGVSFHQHEEVSHNHWEMIRTGTIFPDEAVLDVELSRL